MLPIFRKAGIYANAAFFFEPVPLSYVTLDKATRTDPIIESVGKYCFTKFTPGAFADVGIYYDIVRDKNMLKLFLGFGYEWCDPLLGYRNCRIDGQELSKRIPNKNNLFRITFRVVGFN